MVTIQEVGKILQAVHDSEIHFDLRVFWDSCFDVVLVAAPYEGEQRFLKDEAGNTITADGGRDITEATQSLVDLVITHYPNSVFATRAKINGWPTKGKR